MRRLCTFGLPVEEGLVGFWEVSVGPGHGNVDARKRSRGIGM